MQLNEINKNISLLQDDEKNLVSDGYHTFGELYDHRCVLYVAFVNVINIDNPFIKSKTHFDGTSWDGWFIVQGYIMGKQISYHLPMKYWDNVRCKAVEKSDNRDGHISQDVLNRLLLL